MQIGIYINNKSDLSSLYDIVNFVKEDQDDIFLVVDDILQIPIPIADFACINWRYVRTYFNRMLFLNAEDFNSKASELYCLAAVVVDKKDIMKINKQSKMQPTIIINDTKGLRKAKNAEIQQLYR